MGDRVSIGVGDTATFFETIDDGSGTLTPTGISALTLTVWLCGTQTPVVNAASGDVDGTNPAGGVDVHAPIGPLARGLYLARWRATLTDGQVLSFPSDTYTLIEVT